MEFPSLETLDTSSDGTEYIYGGSVGINRILGFFRTNAYSQNKYDIRLLVVNLYTLFRNVYKKEMSDVDLYTAITTETSLISQYYEVYSYSMRSPIYPPILLIYVPDYESAIPKDILHKKSESMASMHSTYVQFVNSHFPKAVSEMHSEHMYIYVIKTDKGVYPFKSALKVIREYSGPWKLTTTQNGILISHCPLDWYLLTNNTLNMSLMESYTGSIKTKHELGERLTASSHIPFNKYTHLLFGDKYHIAPLLKPKDKKTIIELAEKNHWLSRPTEFIVSDICRTLHISADIVSRLRV